jgi:hypothetical protein
MPDLPALGTAALTVLLVVFLLWFALGTQGNIRRGDRYLKWMQGGLPILGARATVRWLGSSAVELKISDPRSPFTEATTVVVLEPRDLAWLWALGRSRGRRDFIIMRGRLQRSPAFEIEAGHPGGWTGSDRLDRLDESSWQTVEWGEVRVAHTDPADTATAQRYWDEFAALSGGVWRMSVRRDNPHIEVHLLPPDVHAQSAEPLFERFRDLAQSVMARG